MLLYMTLFYFCIQQYPILYYEVCSAYTCSAPMSSSIEFML